MIATKLSKLRAIATGTANGVAIVSMFGLTCLSLYLNRTATAGVAGAMTLALVLVRQLHVLESFEILSLKAKFIARVGEAENLLAHIRRSASVASKLSYVQLAYMNRWGDIGWSRKRTLLGEIDAMLRDVDVPQGEIDAMKVPFLNLVTLDLSRIFEGSVHELLKSQRESIEAKIGSYPSPLSADDTAYMALIAERSRLSSVVIEWGDALGNKALSRLRPELQSWDALALLTSEQRRQADRILDEVATLSETCWTNGTVTKETEEYFARYGQRTNARLDALQAGV